MDKENELRSQAKQLTSVVDVTQADTSKIHDKLEFSRCAYSLTVLKFWVYISIAFVRA